MFKTLSRECCCTRIFRVIRSVLWGIVMSLLSGYPHFGLILGTWIDNHMWAVVCVLYYTICNDRARREILDVLELPFQHPELFGPGCPRRQGVLLYGPPGECLQCTTL